MLASSLARLRIPFVWHWKNVLQARLLTLVVVTQEEFEADVAMLTSMGYSKRHAKEALEENEHNVQAAIDWLLVNCV